MQTVCESSTGTTLPKVLGLEVLHNELTQCLVGGKVCGMHRNLRGKSLGGDFGQDRELQVFIKRLPVLTFVFGNFAFPFFKAALPL